MKICIHGQCNNGKSEAAEILQSLLSWKIIALADAVKDIYCHAFGVTRNFIEKWKRNPEIPPGFKMNVRQGLQLIGDNFRNIHEDCWTDLAIVPGNIIISDGRYLRDAITINNYKGINVVIWRKDHENDDPNKSESEILPVIKHCLETNQDGPIDYLPYHYFLRNDGDKETLRNKISSQLFPFIKGKYEKSP